MADVPRRVRASRETRTCLGVLGRGLRAAVRAPLLVFDIPLPSFSRGIARGERAAMSAALRPGDVLLVTDHQFPLWRLVVRAAGGARASHAAVYEGAGAGEDASMRAAAQVIEATTFHPSGSGVGRTPVAEILTGCKDVYVVRPAWASEASRRTALAWAAAQVGKPYDYAMNKTDGSAHYCAGLVAGMLREAGFDVETARFAGGGRYLPDRLLRPGEGETVRRRTARQFPRPLAFALGAGALHAAGVALPVAAALAAASLLALGWAQYAWFKSRARR